MIAIIRIRGSAKMRKDAEDTLAMLNLGAVNRCVVVPKSPDYQGMITKVKDCVSWGEIDEKVFKKMLLKWGRTDANVRTDEKFFESPAQQTGGKKTSPDGFVKDFFGGKAKLQDAGIRPFFRLHPPRGGYGGIKKPFKLGGALGYRGQKINALLEKMI